MKKYFSHLSLLALALLSVAFVSCSKDDDDPVEEKPSTQIEYNLVKYYSASVNEELLTYYDVKLTLSNDQKTKEVILTPGICEKVTTLVGEVLVYTLLEIDGVQEVKKVQATVTPKDDIERMFAENKAPEILFGANGGILDGYYIPSTGEYMTPSMHCSLWKFEPKGFLEELNGQKQYAIFAETVAYCLMGQ